RRIAAVADRSLCPAILQTAILPLSLGLLGASALVIAQVAVSSWTTAGLAAGTALLTLWFRLNPLWIFAAAVFLGLLGPFETPVAGPQAQPVRPVASADS